jgi:hypothetical protein
VTPLPPTYICPKCREGFDEASFITKTGKRARWCEDCRVSHRQRLTSLNEKKLIKAGFQEMAADVVAKEEGYANHPLAQLLALSHIAGAKRAVAIRDGKSWKGRKAWREYYQAKRELEAKLESHEWLQPGSHENAHRHDPARKGKTICGLTMTGTGWWPALDAAKRCPGCSQPRRDNNSNGVSSK